jgi:hypothetical protein
MARGVQAQGGALVLEGALDGSESELTGDARTRFRRADSKEAILLLVIVVLMCLSLGCGCRCLLFFSSFSYVRPSGGNFGMYLATV